MTGASSAIAADRVLVLEAQQPVGRDEAVGEEDLDLAAQLRNVRGMRIAMPGHADNER